MRTWTFRNREYTMTWEGRGQYKLNGFHCTDAEIWDWANEDSDPKRMGHARLCAERFVNSCRREANL